MMHRFFLFALIGLLSCAVFVSADNNKLQKNSTAKKSTAGEARAKKRKPPFEITPQIESAAMTFVRRHHEEIAGLLPPLKESRPKEYQRAIRDLYRSSERLEGFHQRDRVRYELELSLWKASSRIQLMAARLKMGDSPELHKQLLQALNERIELRMAILYRVQERQSQRLEKLNNQIKKLAASRAQDVERQLLLLTRKSKGRTQQTSKKTPTSIKTKKPKSK